MAPMVLKVEDRNMVQGQSSAQVGSESACLQDPNLPSLSFSI